jgi:hypothetical protein
MATPAFRSSTDGTANSPLNKSPNSSGAIAHGEDSGVPSAMVAWRVNDPALLGQLSSAIAGDNRIATFRGAKQWNPRQQRSSGIEQWEEDIAESARLAHIPIRTLAAGPPSVDQLQLHTHSEQASAAAQYQLELAEYQKHNNSLWDIARASIDISGPFESADRKHFRSAFMVGDLRDGVGLIQWARQFGSTTDVNSQMQLSSKLATYAPLSSDASVTSITVHAFGLYDLWLLVTASADQARTTSSYCRPFRCHRPLPWWSPYAASLQTCCPNKMPCSRILANSSSD